jgi:hypothetical protein
LMLKPRVKKASSFLNKTKVRKTVPRMMRELTFAKAWCVVHAMANA